MRIGDVSRARRFADPVRQRWYAFHRSVRFAMRMRQGDLPTQLPGTPLLRGALASPEVMLGLCLQHGR